MIPDSCKTHILEIRQAQNIHKHQLVCLTCRTKTGKEYKAGYKHIRWLTKTTLTLAEEHLQLHK